MKNINFCLEKDNLDLMKKYNKLSSIAPIVYNKLFFKIDNNKLLLHCSDSTGVFQYVIPVNYEGESSYFSVDNSKFNTALKKFDVYDNIKFEFTKNSLKLSTRDSEDVIVLSSNTYSENSSNADIIDNYVDSRKKDLKNKLELNDQIIDYFALAGSLFVSQGKVNSIGIGPKNIIYADRATILRAFFKEEIDSKFFENLGEYDSYVYIHSTLLNLIQSLYKYNNNIYFSEDYEMLYWKDDYAELVVASEPCELSIPSDEQLEGFSPSEDLGYCVNFKLDELKDSLDFFTGFYEGSVWKPITFELSEINNSYLKYRHPTADITKVLPVSAPKNGKFILDSESLKKVLNKIHENPEVKIIYDDDSPGVSCIIGDYCKVIFAKLSDDEEA